MKRWQTVSAFFIGAAVGAAVVLAIAYPRYRQLGDENALLRLTLQHQVDRNLELVNELKGK